MATSVNASQNLNLLRKLSEQSSFYKNQPVPVQVLNNSDLIEINVFDSNQDVEILDLESEFDGASTPARNYSKTPKKRRLR